MTASDISCQQDQCVHYHSCVSRVPIFQGLSPQELAPFNDLLITREYAVGQTIYSQGSPAQSFCIVKAGAVMLYKTSPDGKEQVLRLLQPGDFFGEAVLFSQRSRGASARATQPSAICHLDKSAAEEVIASNPPTVRKFIAALNQRLLEAEDQIENLGARTTLQRVARLLADLAAEQKGELVNLPLSREGLASFTGMTPENFSRKLSELQGQGLIEPQGRKAIRVLNLARLQELS